MRSVLRSCHGYMLKRCSKRTKSEADADSAIRTNASCTSAEMQPCRAYFSNACRTPCCKELAGKVAKFC
eukprot:7707366-Alexandrium_andersonii.AAC.1